MPPHRLTQDPKDQKLTCMNTLKSFFRFLTCLSLVFLILPSVTQAAIPLSERVSGRILLQVESHGEAWYVDPVTKQRFFLGRAEDAYALMRAKGLGIRHAELARYRAGRFPTRLSGRIVLDVESHGEAYYVLPGSLIGVYLGQARDAYALMRQYGLGITTADLAQIPVGVGPASFPTPTPVQSPYELLERQAFDLINEYRVSKGLGTLVWNTDIANVARQHSVEMANGRVAFGHDGFTDRAKLLQQRISLHGIAENVAYNDYPNSAQTSVTGWIESEGHRVNIENSAYTASGMGVARSSDGAYYFTQLFIAP